MARPLPPPQKPVDSWLMSYSDVVTSLMAFFVLIVAVSTIDQRKIEYIQEAFKEEILKEEFEKPILEK